MTESLEDRMKRYERETNHVLTPKVPVVGRADGKGFSKFTKTLKRSAESPWNMDFVESMKEAAKAACREIQGCQLAYVQSDEISLLITDTSSERAQPYFGYKTRKLNSIVASTVSVEFYAELTGRVPELRDSRPRFDSRFWNLPEDEVVNMFIWRQQDAIRNSVQMYARHFFSHKEVDGKSVAEMKQMLIDRGSPWESLPYELRHGVLVTSKKFQEEVTFTRKGEEQTVMATRNRWVARPAPLFVGSRHTINQYL